MQRSGAPSARTSRAATAAALVLAGVGPLAVVVLLSSGPFASRVVPDFVAGPARFGDNGTVLTLLADLAESMNTMSIGLLVATAWLSRQPWRPAVQRLAAPILAAGGLLAVTSIYAGLRFRFDLAAQLRVIPFDFDRLKDRLFWQGAALLFQVSVLCMAGAAHQLGRDPRVGRERS